MSSSTPKQLPRESVRGSPVPSTDDDVENIIAQLSIEEKRTLALQFCEQSDKNQQLLDKLLVTFARSDFHTLLAFSAQAEKTRASKKWTNKAEMNASIASQALQLEFKTFWSVPANLKLVTDQKQINKLQHLSSYVPRLVLRRLLTRSDNIRPPEMESFPACVAFADISGFTALAERLGVMGTAQGVGRGEGVERLSKALNAYFELLIGTIYQHGGDVIKFAGDALLIVWPAATESGLAEMIILACQCCKALTQRLGDYKVEETGTYLKLHIGLAAEVAAGVFVGGTNDRLEFFVSGDVLEQVSQCEKQAAPGEVFVASHAWILAREKHNGFLAGTQRGGSSNWRLDAVKTQLELPPAINLPYTVDLESKLNQYVQPQVLRHMNSSAAEKWLAELRTVSVIFVNLTTPFKPSKLDELQKSITAMQKIIFDLEGIVRQFMIDDKGSVLIAGFGLPPYAHEDDPLRAVTAAIEIHSTLSSFKVPCSIGVTTGSAFCGDVGDRARREYAMVGDIVNLSARLMAAAKTGILVDPDTYELVKSNPTLEFTPQDPMKFKGKEKPIVTYIPRRQKRQNKTTDHTKGGVVKEIVGRQKEIQALHTQYLKLKLEVDHTRVIVIEGEAGVGKSRLCRVLSDKFISDKRKVFTGHADQLHNNINLFIWQDIFETVIQDGKLPKEFIAAVGNDQLLPLLNSVMPNMYPEPTQMITEMSNQVYKQTTIEVLVRVLKVMVPPGSLLRLENVNWMDSYSWSLAMAASKQLQGVMIVMTTRPMETGKTPFEYGIIMHQHHTNHIVLKNLSEEATGALIAQLLDVDQCPGDVVSKIYKQSEGNPFMTEQLVGALRENGVLKAKNGTVKMKEDKERGALSFSLQALLTSKVDKLTTDQQRLLKVASVIGGEFSVKMLMKVMPDAPEGEEVVKKQLKDIENTGLIKREAQAQGVGHQDGVYVFVNSLINDVIYNMMLFEQRRAFHLRIGNFYDEHLRGLQEGYYLIAYHFKRSAEKDKDTEYLEKAREYFSKAGSASLLHYSNKEAILSFAEAIDIMRNLKVALDTIDAISTERKLGQAHMNLGQFGQAKEHFLTALTNLGITVPANDKAKVKSALKKPITLDKGKKKGEVLPKAEIHHRKREAIIILFALAKAYFYSCNLSLAEYCAQRSLQISEDVGAAVRAEAMATAGLVAGLQNEMAQFENYMKQAREQAGRQLDVLKVIEQICGIVYAGQAQWAQAKTAFEKAVDAARTVGDLKSLEESSLLLGTAYYMQGDVQQSIKVSQDALESATKRGDGQLQSYASVLQARNYYAIGDAGKCVGIIDELRLPKQNSEISELSYQAIKALLHFRKRELKEAHDTATEAYNTLSLLDPTSFELLLPFSVIPEVIFELLALPKSEIDAYRAPPATPQTPSPTNSLASLPVTKVRSGSVDFNLDKSKLATKLKKLVQLMEKFAAQFPTAQPRLNLVRAYLKVIDGKAATIGPDIDKGLEMAGKLGMVYDEAFLLFQKGRLMKNEDLFKQAKGKFSQIECLAMSPEKFRQHDKNCDDPQHPHSSNSSKSTIRKNGGLMDSD